MRGDTFNRFIVGVLCGVVGGCGGAVEVLYVWRCVYVTLTPPLSLSPSDGGAGNVRRADGGRGTRGEGRRRRRGRRRGCVCGRRGGGFEDRTFFVTVSRDTASYGGPVYAAQLTLRTLHSAFSFILCTLHTAHCTGVFSRLHPFPPL